MRQGKTKKFICIKKCHIRLKHLFSAQNYQSRRVSLTSKRLSIQAVEKEGISVHTLGPFKKCRKLIGKTKTTARHERTSSLHFRNLQERKKCAAPHKTRNEKKEQKCESNWLPLRRGKRWEAAVEWERSPISICQEEEKKGPFFRTPPKKGSYTYQK